MAQTFTKTKLSWSTNGKLIQVSWTATGSANTIHTAVSWTTNYDEPYIYAVNTDTVARLLTIEWGGTGTANEVKVSIPAQSWLMLDIPWMILQNSLVIKAYADTTNIINIWWYVHNIVNT